jgi:hypothetical protein
VDDDDFCPFSSRNPGNLRQFVPRRNEGLAPFPVRIVVYVYEEDPVRLPLVSAGGQALHPLGSVYRFLSDDEVERLVYGALVPISLFQEMNH